MKLYITTAQAPPSGPGFGIKTVRDQGLTFFYYDASRHPSGKEDPGVLQALKTLEEDMPRRPEKFCNCTVGLASWTYRENMRRSVNVMSVPQH